MTDRQYNIVGVGEVLWDCLPTGRQIGGAPANFAYMATKLGELGLIASRVGADADGDALLSALAERGLDTTFIQRDAAHPTSRVEVSTDARGQPSYTIHEGVAWDYLDSAPALEFLAQQADAVCFGTLAQRSPVSRAAIRRFVAMTRADALRIFDANLRQAFFDDSILQASLELADACKLNHEELPHLAQVLGLGGDSLETQAARLREAFGLRFVCVTRGANGSLLVTANCVDKHPGLKVKVADTVGAGDAFTAALVCAWLRGEALPHINEAANRAGAWVASHNGGMPI